MKKIVLTYYYVFFQQHFRSKYAAQMNSAWQSALLQLSISALFLFASIQSLIEIFVGAHLYLNKFAFISIFLILPTLLIYHLLFNIYKASKYNDDETLLKIKITRSKKIIAWVCWILIIAIGFVIFYYHHKIIFNKKQI